MKSMYAVDGMTCDGCVTSVRQGLESVPGVESADVQLAYPQVHIATEQNIPTAELQDAIGKYEIREIEQNVQPPPLPATPPADVPDPGLGTFRPLIMIVSFILLVTVLAQWPLADFDWMQWMRHFMAGFFVVFSFFKLLNVRGFASSYAMYDLLAARWHTWGLIYPFVELALGVLYLIDVFPLWTNVATIVILGFSSIGVIKSNLNKRKIKCACLGDVFNLPMSTVTIIEDVGMVAMALAMLLVA